MLETVLSSAFPDDKQTPISSPTWLIIKCNLKPKNHPTESLPLVAKSLNTLNCFSRFILPTIIFIESMKAIPVDLPNLCFIR